LTGPDQRLRVARGVARWVDLAVAQLDALRDIERLVDRAAMDAVARARGAEDRTLVIGAALLALAVALSLGLAGAVAHSIGGALRQQHDTAWLAAYEQASVGQTALRMEGTPALRGGHDGVSTMFANLAQRSSRLVDGLIEQLDVAERDEPDP